MMPLKLEGDDLTFDKSKTNVISQQEARVSDMVPKIVDFSRTFLASSSNFIPRVSKEHRNHFYEPEDST